jgi:Family of unknown function (DUF5947)
MTSTLRRLAGPKPPPPPAADERCEFCGVGIDERHGHVADVADHRLLCVCRPCYLLFAPQGAGGGRYRGVGEEVSQVADLALAPTQWDALRIPVDLAFFFHQTQPGEDPRLLAFYPGPAGATESELDLTAWAGIAGANPVLADVQPDVEAVLLRRRGDEVSCYLVPIDVCYELVGLVRSAWTGLGGGAEVWRLIDNFFDGLDERAEPVARARPA